MLGWMFTETGAPLTLEEIDEPRPGPGEVLIEVRSAGLCHSDVSALEHPEWLDIITARPVVFGHEISGVVLEIGTGVTEVVAGQAVGVCPASLRGGGPGYTRHGGFTFKHVAPAVDVVAIPAGLGFELAAMGTDAGMTSHHAMVTRGGVTIRSRVGVIGLGGLGQIGAGIAVLKGAEVYVADVNEATWPIARALGVKSVARSIEEFAGEYLDLIVDYAGAGTSTRDALRVIRPGGRIVVVGMANPEITIETMNLIMKRVELVGSLGGSKADIASVYDYFVSGSLQPTFEVIGFPDIPRGLEDLKNHRVRGRLIANVSP